MDLNFLHCNWLGTIQMGNRFSSFFLSKLTSSLMPNFGWSQTKEWHCLACFYSDNENLNKPNDCLPPTHLHWMLLNTPLLFQSDSRYSVGFTDLLSLPWNSLHQAKHFKSVFHWAWTLPFLFQIYKTRSTLETCSPDRYFKDSHPSVLISSVILSRFEGRKLLISKPVKLRVLCSRINISVSARNFKTVRYPTWNTFFTGNSPMVFLILQFVSH